jgi:SAM-dependent methyltransferase
MSKVSPPPTSYSGVENLEVMREARNYNRYLLALVRRHAENGAATIDFGAGAGTFAIPCAAAGLKITAIEPDAGLRTRLSAQGVVTAAHPDELPDRAFDYAYTLNVLEHIVDDVGALKDLHAKLAPNARLLIYVPAFPMLFTSMDTQVGHLRRYKARTLTACANAAGFEVEWVRYADSLGFLATVLFKLVGNDQGTINRRMLRVYDRWVFPLSALIDYITRPWLGKNVVMLARKPAAQ